MKTILRKTIVTLTTTFALTSAVQAADVTLRFAHFWPAVAPIHKELFQHWADAVESDSNGRIKVEIYPGSTLSKPPAQYAAVINRIADMTATVQGYTANRFPLTQIVELPGIVTSAEQGSCVVQSLYDEGLIASEYQDTRPLFLFTHGQGHLHLKGASVRTPEDLAGLRLRRPTRVVGDLLESLQAQPVGMPAPNAYAAMQRGVIDGVALPWEGIKSFRINELADTHTEIGLYSLAFIVTMNKSVYDRLPADLKRIIDQHAGLKLARQAGQLFDQVDTQARQEAQQLGHQIVTIEGGHTNPAWKPVLDKVTAEYLDSLEQQGLPARQVYQRAKDLAEQCR